MEMSRGAFISGETVVIIDRKGREYLFELKEGGRFHSGDGSINHDEIIGRSEGEIVLSSIRMPFLVFRPTLSQVIMNMPRQAQIIYPKDIGIIILWADIHSCSRVVEIGTGFGALTMAIARTVGEGGILVSYEVREEVAKRAMKNLERFVGRKENIVIKNKDASGGIEEEDVDCIITDVPQPWLLLEQIEKALRPGGILLNFLPTIIQVREITEALRSRRTFGLVQTIETLLRPWNIEGMSVRPVHRMQAHTGFITTSRRLKGGFSLT